MQGNTVSMSYKNPVNINALHNMHLRTLYRDELNINQSEVKMGEVRLSIL